MVIRDNIQIICYLSVVVVVVVVVALFLHHPRARGNRVTYNQLKSWGPIFPLGRASRFIEDNWFQKSEQNIIHNNKAINQP